MGVVVTRRVIALEVAAEDGDLVEAVAQLDGLVRRLGAAASPVIVDVGARLRRVAAHLDPTGTDRRGPVPTISRRAREVAEAAGVDALLTVDAVADYLAVSARTVERLVASGELRSVRIGRARRIPVAAVRGFRDRLEQQEDAA